MGTIYLNFDYDAYEKRCEEIRVENEQLLYLFAEDLKASGLKEKTIKKHLWNVDYYINEFMLRMDALPMAHGLDMISDFLGYFFIQKCSWSTPASIKTTAASIKKFYKCMLAHKKIEKNAYDDFCFTIKECMDDWQIDCALYNDPNAHNPFGDIWL